MTIVLCFAAAAASGATSSAGGCSEVAVQSAINAANNGDVVSLPAGCNATWSSRINIPATKYITLDGKGSRITRNMSSNGPIIAVTTNPAGMTRITGFVFAHQAGTGYAARYISVGGGWNNAKFRIDHNTFGTCGSDTHVTIYDALGVIDNNVFHMTGGGEIIHVEAYGPSDATGWQYNVVPGSDDAVYIEDNKFYNAVSGNPAYFWGGSAVQSYYGARTVFRYNYCQMCQIDQHGTSNSIGARWWEIYENTFDVVTNGNQSAYVVLRGGSGVVFNNHKTGFNQNGGSIDIYEEDSGYPALYQVGRGKNQVLYPAYIWNNGPSMPVGSDSMVQVNRDYYLSAKPGYVPLRHPHPLIADATVPEPPTDVTVLP